MFTNVYWNIHWMFTGKYQREWMFNGKSREIMNIQLDKNPENKESEYILRYINMEIRKKSRETCWTLENPCRQMYT